MSNLSDREWTVLTALWSSGGSALGELTEALRPETGWSRNTVLTYLTRMEAKGLLRYEQQGRTKLYFPCLDRQQAAMHQTRRFLDRVYQGSVSLMVNAMLDQKSLSSQQIQQLRDLLDRAEEEEE